MGQNETVIEGHLEKKERKIKIKVVYGSKYSLFVKFKQYKYQENEVFDKLVLHVVDQDFEFGSCQFVLESNMYDFSGRLIFLTDLYDFRAFFVKQKMINLQVYHVNLALNLERKEQIKPSFKEYTASLAYDLEVYKDYFNDLESKYEEEPKVVREANEKAIIETEGRKFMAFLGTKLDELKKEVADYSKKEHERHGYYFRKQLWDIIQCSEFLVRTNTKPRGYAGDSKMMTLIYENEYRGKSIFSKIIHKYSVDDIASQTVRNRIGVISRTLRDHLKNHLKGNFKFMSVACGPAAELESIFMSREDFDRYRCTLLDQDIRALNEAAENIKQIERRTGNNIKVNYRVNSVRMILRASQLIEKWDRFHFIYSLGLFDYLTPPVAKAVIKKLYELILPGGMIVIGNYHVNNPSKQYMEYWCDWVLYHRTEEDFIDLLAEIPQAEASISFEETRSQMFLHITKPR